MDTNPIRVLLIEDDLDDVLLLKESLTEAKAVKVKLIHADRLSEGLKRLAKQKFDIVLLDLNLPDSRGLDTLSSLLRQASTIPIVVLSGLADDVTTLEAVKQGAQDFLVKGEISGPMLARVLRYAIERKQIEKSLRMSEARNQALLNAIPDLIFHIRHDGIFIDYKAEKSEDLFVPPDAFLGKKVTDVLPQAVAEPIMSAIRATLETSRLQSLEYQLTIQNEPRCFEARFVTNSPDEVIAISRDITERKRAEETLNASEVRYRRLFEAARDGILILDHETGMVVDVNPFLVEMLGYSREQFFGKRIWEIGFFKDIAANKSNFAELQQKEFIQYENLPLETNHGRLINVEFVSHVYQVGANKVIQCNIRDITERKQMEIAVAESEKNYRMLFENMPVGLYRTTSDGRMVDANPALVKMFGIQDHEALFATKVEDLYADPADNAKFLNAIRQSDIVSNFEAELRRRDGSTFWASDNVRVNRDDKGNILSYEGSIVDITERKLAEAAIQRRDMILETLAYSGEHLLRSTVLEEHLPNILSHLGKAVEVSRVYLFENSESPDGKLLTSQRYEWVAEGIAPQIHNPDLQNFNLADNGFSRWIEIMEQGGTLHGNLRDFPETERDVLSAQDIQSMLIMPILIEQKWWGFIGFDDCLAEREWYATDIEALKTAAGTLGAAIQRKQSEEALQRQARELTTLYESAMAISSNLSLDVVLKTVVEQVIKAVNVDGCALSSLDIERGVVLTMVDYNVISPDAVDTPGKTYFLNDYPATRHALETYQPLLLSHSNPQADAAELALMHEQGMSTVLLLPLIARNKVIGLMELYEVNNKERTFTDDEMRLAQSLSVQTAIFIDNARLFEHAERRLARTEALHTIDIAIAGSMDVGLVLNVILDQALSQLGMDAAVILLCDPEAQVLKYANGRGFRTETLQHTRLPLGEGYAGRVALERQIVYIPDLRTRKTDFLRSPSFSQEGFVSYFGVPLIAKGEIKGVLEIFHRAPFKAETEWLHFLEMLAGQAAIAIDNATLFKNLQLSNIELIMAYDATIAGWSHAMDLRDKETQDHTLRVTEMTERLARAMGIGEAELVHIHRGALLHDIGKMGVSDSILLKPGKLTEDEWALMRQHPQAAHDLLAPIAYLRPAMDIPYCHHEKWDGTGYPRGLKGEQIPLAARIFAVVDVYDALTSDRPYRKAWDHEKVIEHIKSLSGTHFEPRVVELFLDMIKKNKQASETVS